MNETTKACLVFGGGMLLFWIMKPVLFKKKPEDLEPEVAVAPPTAEQVANAKIVLNAYRMAVEAGEDEDALDDLNRIMLKEYGLRVQRVARSGAYIVTDTTGKEIPAE